ncbi:MAG: hypothetical protein R3E32_03700 [Chitinophagales bacterium]
MKSIHLLGILILSICFLTACGNKNGQTPSADMGKDSLSMVKEIALRNEVSSRALKDRIADFKLLCSIQKKGKYNIHILNGDGTNLQQITDDKGNDLLPKWLPDATGFVFESDRNGKPHTYFFSLEDSLYKQVSRFDFKERSPSASKDNEILFTSDKDKAQHIYRMDRNGDNLQKLTATTYNDAYPVWSPDALSFAFHSFRHDNQSEIFVADRSGSNLVRITDNNALDFTPDWSPDGKELVFVSNRTGNYDIFRVKANGEGEPVNITNTPDINEMMPTWSPDGAYIAYVASTLNESHVYVMTADGAVSARITPNNMVATMPNWRPPTEMEKAMDADKPSTTQKVEVRIGD